MWSTIKLMGITAFLANFERTHPLGNGVKPWLLIKRLTLIKDVANYSIFFKGDRLYTSKQIGELIGWRCCCNQSTGCFSHSSWIAKSLFSIIIFSLTAFSAMVLFFFNSSFGFAVLQRQPLFHLELEPVFELNFWFSHANHHHLLFLGCLPTYCVSAIIRF